MQEILPVVREKAVVFGGTGLLGLSISRELASRGFEVTGISRSNYALATDQANFLHHSVNLQTVKDVGPLISAASLVVLVLQSSSPAKEDNQTNFDSEDFLKSIIEAAAIGGITRIAFASSGGAVYGDHGVTPLAETTELRPKSRYGRNKAAAENAVQEYCSALGIISVIWRFGNLYGPRQDVTRGQGLVSLAYFHSVKRIPLDVMGQGSSVRDYIHVSDAASAAVEVALATDRSDIYNIASGKGLSVNQVIELVEKFTGVPIVRNYVDLPAHFVEYNVLDNTKLINRCPAVVFRDLRDGVLDYSSLPH